MLQDYVTPNRGHGWGWNRVPVPRGTSIVGCISGVTRIAKTHYVADASKPCIRAATGGAVPCYCESKAVPKRTYGYVPLTTKDGANIVVILCESEAKRVKLLPHGYVIEIVSPETPKVKTYARTNLDDVMPSSVVKAVQARPPASIDEWLVYCLWHDQAVMDYFNARDKKEQEAKRPKLNLKVPKQKGTGAAPNDNAVSLGNLLNGIGRDPNAKA